MMSSLCLKEICNLQNGFAFKSKDYVESSNTINFRMSQIRPGGRIDLKHNPKFLPNEFVEKYKDYLLKDGDIVIAMTDMASDTKILGVPTIVKSNKEKLLLNQRVGKLYNIDLRVVSIPYLRYILTAPQIYAQYKKLGKGGVQINLGKDDILGIHIPVFSLLEQKAIVAKIEQLFSELDKGIESLKTAQAKLKIYRQAVLKKEFEGDYKLVEIGDVCDVFVGATPSRKNTNYWDGDIYWVSSGEVKFNTINNTKEKITEEGLKNTSTVLHPPQTILLAMIGEGKTRGQCAILNIHAAHNQNTAALRAKKELLDFRFLYNFLVYTYEDTRRIGSGNNQKALNKARVSALTLPLPTIEEQNQIVQEIESRLSLCDKIEQTISDALIKAEALRQSILKKAFEGKLLHVKELEAIKSHPEYESAEKLLQRIKLERAK